MKKIWIIVLLSTFMNVHIVYADQSISNQAYEAYEKGEKLYKKEQYDEALKWLKMSYEEDPSKEAAFDIGLIYQALKEFNTAIKWYEISYHAGSVESGTNLGYIYKNINKDYKKSIEWYEKAANQGVESAIYNLAILYQEMDNLPKAIQWYQKGVQLKDYDSIKNLGNLYHNKGENVQGAAYMLGLLSIKPEKKVKLIKYLKSKWELSDIELQQAYQLQKTLIPDPYYDPEFEAKITQPKKHKTGRR